MSRETEIEFFGTHRRKGEAMAKRDGRYAAEAAVAGVNASESVRASMKRTAPPRANDGRRSVEELIAVVEKLGEEVRTAKEKSRDVDGFERTLAWARIDEIAGRLRLAKWALGWLPGEYRG